VGRARKWWRAEVAGGRRRKRHRRLVSGWQRSRLSERSIRRRSGCIRRIPVGGEPRPVTRDGIVSKDLAATVDWSPTGDVLAFPHGDAESGDIWSIPAAGGEPSPVTASSGQFETLPRFSSDGRQIAYSGESEAGVGIWTVPSSGGLPTLIVDWPQGQWGPTWSPDQTRFAFYSTGGPNGQTFQTFQIWTASATVGRPTWLAEGVDPDWSPDGREVIYSRLKIDDFNVGGDIWKVQATGGDPVPVLESPEGKYWPRWSPDGSEILFGRPTEILADVFIVDVRSLINR
jgi:Tol biopolymer transport system component